jgi:type VI secretion system secreted protein VgrG
MIQLALPTVSVSLSPQRLLAREAMNALFEVTIFLRSPSEDIPFDSAVGEPAFLLAHGPRESRAWSGVCRSMRFIGVESDGWSAYELVLVPKLWQLTQRSNCRIFQHESIPDIARRLLRQWRVEHVFRIDEAQYPKLEQRVQYHESDYTFLCRLLGEAGISFYFEGDVEKGSLLVLADRPQAHDPRIEVPLRYIADPHEAQGFEGAYATDVRVGNEVRPGRLTIRDHDFRRPVFPLAAESVDVKAPNLEKSLEQYHYRPGAFLVEVGRGGDTPVADDQGAARHKPRAGDDLAKRSLRSERSEKRTVAFESNAISLGAGALIAIGGHPRTELSPEKALLVTAASIEGALESDWIVEATAVFADRTYRPATPPRPVIDGVQSAIVVGPPGKMGPQRPGEAGDQPAEIHTDEYGRVRVQFHWNREGHFDRGVSCWARVSQGWAGPGSGMTMIPRVGNEVLVGFMEGNPDQPVVVGRVHNALSPVPYKLPKASAVSTWRSLSSPGGAGSNEILFDDTADRELLYMRASKDAAKLVKQDETTVVGKDATRVTRRNETLVVGRNRVKVVKNQALDGTQYNRLTTIGGSRHTVVGKKDLRWVGKKFVAKVVPALKSELPQDLQATVTGRLAPLLDGAVAGTLGLVPQTPLGGAPQLPPDQAGGPLPELARQASRFKKVNKRARGVIGAPRPSATDGDDGSTALFIEDERVTLTTGQASIIISGSKVELKADGNILVIGEGEIVTTHKINDFLSPGQEPGEELTTAPQLNPEDVFGEDAVETPGVPENGLPQGTLPSGDETLGGVLGEVASQLTTPLGNGPPQPASPPGNEMLAQDVFGEGALEPPMPPGNGPPQPASPSGNEPLGPMSPSIFDEK